MEKKKLSGAEYRKRKAAREIQEKKLQGQLNKFLKKNDNSSVNINSTSNEPQDLHSLTLENVTDSHSLALPDQHNERENMTTTEYNLSSPHQTENIVQVSETVSGDFSSFKANDPATWPEIITDKIRKVIIEQGAMVQITNKLYPRDDSGRSFSNNYYYRKIANNDTVSRTWLKYSSSKNCVFCSCCKLFAGEKSHLTTDGFSNWQNLSKTLSFHEVSRSHLTSFIKWVQLKKQLEKHTTIDSELEKVYEREKRHWRSVLERIIEIIKYLAKQNLALRGSSDIIFQKNNGNFLKLVELFSKFDIVMENHLAKIQNTEKDTVHYLGKNIQNEIISLISKKCVNAIVQRVSNAKYFSIILDCTPDISHTEQMTVIIRFVHKNESNQITVEEHFLGFVEINDSTGEGLFRCIVEKLKELNLNIKHLRGQGYDNGANMRGKHSGVQRRILNENPRAFFVPCAAHTLNLVVSDAAKVNTETIIFFGIIQELYNFFCASTKRWDVLKQFSKITLKPLSDTRWESRIDALSPLRNNIGDYLDALLAIYDNENNDNNTKSEAKSLAMKLDYEFICSLIIWYEILSRINVVSKMFQSSNTNLNESTKCLNNLITFFKEFRLDDNFSNILKKAITLAEDVDISPQFKENPLRRRKKRMFNYESRDERPRDPEQNYKISFFLPIVDSAINSLIERFELLNSHAEKFQFLINFNEIYNLGDEVMKNKCTDLQTALTDGEEIDINSSELYNELFIFKDTITQLNNYDPLNILNYMYTNDLFGIFPNLTIALRILLTLPVSVASGERSFSKLKLIKTYLRSNISQERLVGLAMIAIESDICDELKINDILDEFAAIKARKINF